MKKTDEIINYNIKLVSEILRYNMNYRKESFMATEKKTVHDFEFVGRLINIMKILLKNRKLLI